MIYLYKSVGGVGLVIALELGNFYLEQGDFSLAIKNFYFALTSDCECEKADIYYGLILANRQCKSLDELLSKGFPIPLDDENYIAFSKCTPFIHDSNKTIELLNLRKLSLIACRVKIISFLKNNFLVGDSFDSCMLKDKFLFEKWLYSYEFACDTKDDFLTVCKTFLNENKNLALMSGVLLKLIEILNDDYEFSKEYDFVSLLPIYISNLKTQYIGVMESIKKQLLNYFEKSSLNDQSTPAMYRDLESYSNYVEQYRSKFKKYGIPIINISQMSRDKSADKITPTRISLREQWCNPVACLTRTLGVKVSIGFGLDNSGQTTSERYVFLAEYFWKEVQEKRYLKIIEGLYELAHTVDENNPKIHASYNNFLIFKNNQWR